MWSRAVASWDEKYGGTLNRLQGKLSKVLFFDGVDRVDHINNIEYNVF